MNAADGPPTSLKDKEDIRLLWCFQGTLGWTSRALSNRERAAKSLRAVLRARVYVVPEWYKSHEKTIQWSNRHLGNTNNQIFMNYYYKELQQEGRKFSDLLVNIFSVTVFATSILKNQANKHHCCVQLVYTKNRIINGNTCSSSISTGNVHISHDILNHLAVTYATLTKTQVFFIAHFKVVRRL